MVQAHVRREALKQKAQIEREKLSQLHLVTTSEELHEVLVNIDALNISATKKRGQKPSFLRNQVNIRKKGFRTDYLYYVQSFWKTTTSE